MSLESGSDISFAEAVKVLGLAPNKLTPEIVKTAYRIAAKTTHPDAPGGSDEKFKKVNAAYELLKEIKADGTFTGKGFATGGVVEVDFTEVFRGFSGMFRERYTTARKEPSDKTKQAVAATVRQCVLNQGIDIAVDALRELYDEAKFKEFITANKISSNTELLMALIVLIQNRKFK